MDPFEWESERIVPLIIIHRQQIIEADQSSTSSSISSELSQDRSFFEYEMQRTEDGD